jgi:hypothetical protein
MGNDNPLLIVRFRDILVYSFINIYSSTFIRYCEPKSLWIPDLFLQTNSLPCIMKPILSILAHCFTLYKMKFCVINILKCSKTLQEFNSFVCYKRNFRDIFRYENKDNWSLHSTIFFIWFHFIVEYNPRVKVCIFRKCGSGTFSRQMDLF